MYCKYCGAQLKGTEKFCTYCGKPVAETATDTKTAPKNFCRRCGQVINEGQTVCPFCNQPVGNNAAPFYTAPAPQQDYSNRVPVGKGTKLAIFALSFTIFSPFIGFLFRLFGLLFPVVGAVLSVIAIIQGKGSSNKSAVVLGIIALCISVLVLVVNIVLLYPIWTYWEELMKVNYY